MPTHLLLKGSSLSAMDGYFDSPEDGLQSLSGTGAVCVEVIDYLLTSEIREKIAASRLGLVIQTLPTTVGELDPPLELADLTRARAINLHVRLPDIDEDAAATLVRGLIDRASEAGTPLLFETHHGGITQDPNRTARLLEAVPDMKLTLDASQYVLAENQPGVTPQLRELLEPLLDRVEMIRGRLLNGQQEQSPVIDADSELADSYRQLWAETMRRWRRRKPAGSTLIFTPKPGPPSAVTTQANGEISENRQQSATIWKIAQEAWKQSAR